MKVTFINLKLVLKATLSAKRNTSKFRHASHFINTSHACYHPEKVVDSENNISGLNGHWKFSMVPHK